MLCNSFFKVWTLLGEQQRYFKFIFVFFTKDLCRVVIISNMMKAPQQIHAMFLEVLGWIKFNFQIFDLFFPSLFYLKKKKRIRKANKLHFILIFRNFTPHKTVKMVY